MTLHPGDREWWDRRYWKDLVQTPVAIGAWPEPFVHGYDGHRHPVAVADSAARERSPARCAADGARARRQRQARVTETFGAPPRRSATGKRRA